MNLTFDKEGRKYFKNRITKDNGCVLVAVVDNKIVGYLSGGIEESKRYRNLSTISYLENMMVLDKYRSNGIGSELITSFIKWSKDKKQK